MESRQSAAQREQERLLSEGDLVGRTVDRVDPNWGAQLVVAGALLLDFSLPDKLTLGPSWLLPSVEALLLAGLIVITPHPRMRHSPLRRKISLALIAVVSLVNAWSLAMLVHFLLQGGKSTGRSLVGAGAELWVTNVLLFGLWYWQLDRGGPLERAMRTGRHADFLFPQMSEPRWAPENWEPNLIDYLYVSFTNAAAFSPTDTMPLSRSAKLLMAGQSMTALVTVGLVVARAVNILNG